MNREKKKQEKRSLVYYLIFVKKIKYKHISSLV